MRKVLYPLLVAPAAFVAGFFAYVEFANDPGCGSQAPGPCFAVGVLLMVVAPIALLALIALVVLVIFDVFKSRANRKLSS